MRVQRIRETRTVHVVVQVEVGYEMVLKGTVVLPLFSANRVVVGEHNGLHSIDSILELASMYLVRAVIFYEPLKLRKKQVPTNKNATSIKQVTIWISNSLIDI